MIHLLMAMMIAAPGSGSIGESRMILRDPQQGPTAVTDKDLRPGRLPYCRSDAEVQRAVEQVRNGETGDCFVRDVKAFNRRGG
jgi:hypothetical protein